MRQYADFSTDVEIEDELRKVFHIKKSNQYFFNFYFKQTPNEKKLYHQRDAGFAMNFSRSKIFIEGGGNYGFVNIQKDSENGKNKIGAGFIRIGYAFGF